MPATADWRIMLTLLITGKFEVCSILHVALLVFLRLIAVIKPMGNKGGIIAKRNYVLAVIWILIITNNSLRFVFFTVDYKDCVHKMDQFNFWALVVTPVVLIVSFYVILIFSVRRKKSRNENTMSEQGMSIKEKENARTTKIVMRLVIVLLICYIPYISLLAGLYAEVSHAVSLK